MRQLIQDTIERTPGNAYLQGKKAKFIQIDEDWGFKFYSYKEDANQTYEMQKYLASHGLAPQVGEQMCIRLPNGSYQYGYVTEVAAILSDIKARQLGFKDELEMCAQPNGRALYNQCDDEWEDSDDFIWLTDQIRKVKVEEFDTHVSNVGYIRGKIVVIDVHQYEFKEDI